MGLSSLHVCMDSPSDHHWFQDTIHDESGMDSFSSPSPGDMILTCTTTTRAPGGSGTGIMTERRLRPPHHDQAQKCPRCDSTHTKFCYYNNYSLSQPRYFCKTCRRYWTKGGTLRNIPVGGGCRKNKKPSSSNNNNKKPSSNNNNNNQNPNFMTSPKDLQQYSFPADVQFSHLSNFLGANNSNGGIVMGNPNFMLDHHSPNNIRPIDFMESKLEGIIGSTSHSSSSSRNFDFFGNGGLGDHNINNVGGFHALGFGGMSLNDGGNNYMMMQPYDHDHDGAGGEEEHDSMNAPLIDVKPNPKLLSLEWQQPVKDSSSSFGYLNGPGSWSGMINGYGSSTTNPLL